MNSESKSFRKEYQVEGYRNEDAARHARNFDVSDFARHAIEILLQRFAYVILPVFILLIPGLYYHFTTPQKYVSQSLISIDPRNLDGINSPTLPNVFFAERLVVDSEINKIHSEIILRDVASQEPFLTSAMQHLEEAGDPIDEQSVLAAAIAQIRDGLSVEREGETFIISIRYESLDPILSAKVVNDVAEAYISSFERARIDQAAHAAAWIEAELSQLTLEMREAENRISELRLDLSLPDEGSATQIEREIEENNSRIAEKRREIADYSIAIDVIDLASEKITNQEHLDYLYIASELDSAELQSLANLIADLRSRRASSSDSNAGLLEAEEDLLRRYQSELNWLRRSNLSSIESDLMILKSLEDYGTKLAIGLADSSKVGNELLRQERALDALRSEEAVLLDRQQASLRSSRYVVGPARIIEHGQPPSKSSNPGLAVVVVGSVIGGLIIGMAFVFALEQVYDGMRRSDDVTRSLGVPFLGTIPRISHRALRRLDLQNLHLERKVSRSERMNLALLSYAINAPRTRFAESIRRVVYEIERGPSGNCAIAVVSPLQNEGKSVLASNIAFYMASMGKSVLLVDGDRHQRSLSNAFAPILSLHPENSEDSAFQENDIYRINDGLSFLRTRAPDERSTGGYLGLSELIEKPDTGGIGYDVVIIDTPALAHVGDALEYSSFITGAVAAFTWGRTSAGVANRVLSGVPVIREMLIGACLTNAPGRRALRFERLPTYRYS